MNVSMRSLATFAVAIFLGIVAVILTRNYVNNAARVTSAPASTGFVSVVVAAQPLDRGVVLEPNVLKAVSFPSDAAPSNAFRDISELTGGRDQKRVMLRNVVANEPIMASNVSGPGGKLNLSGAITEGMRAVSLRSSDVAGVGGFVLPGDRVDVLLTRTTEGNDASKTVTQVLAENVRVLGVDQSDNSEADKPVVSKAITVEVTPDQAQSISLGQNVGTVSLTLRRVADDTPLGRKATAVSDLALTPRRVATPSAPAGPAIRVVRGTEASRVSLSAGLERTAAKGPAGGVSP